MDNSAPQESIPLRRNAQFDRHTQEDPVKKSQNNFQKILMKVDETIEVFLRDHGPEFKEHIKLKFDHNKEKLTSWRRRLSFLCITPSLILKFTKERIKKLIKYKKQKKEYMHLKDEISLIYLVQLYSNVVAKGVSQFEVQDWKYINSMFPQYKLEVIIEKYMNFTQSNAMDKNLWTQEEENILSALVNQYGTNNWNFIAKQLFKLNPDPSKAFRTFKRVRQHWNSFLNPNIKRQPWTLQEDYQLLTKLRSHNYKWAELSKVIEGRRQESIRTRFYQLRKANNYFLQGLDQKQSIEFLFMKISEDLQTELFQQMMTPSIQQEPLELQALVPQQDLFPIKKKQDLPSRRTLAKIPNLRSKQKQFKKRMQERRQEQNKILMVQSQYEQEREESIFNGEEQADNEHNSHENPVERQVLDEQKANFMNSPIIQTEKYQFLGDEVNESLWISGQHFQKAMNLKRR